MTSILAGVHSVPARAGGHIVSYRWELLSAPPKSTAELTAPNAVDTKFSFSSSGEPYFGVDVSGTSAAAHSHGRSGLTSQNDGRLRLDVAPSDGLHVQLTWDVPDDDIDLHLRRNELPWCAETGCYYGNCTVPEYAPNWDGEQEGHAGESVAGHR